MIIDSIINLYLKKTNPVKWARHLGIKVGKNTTISSSTKFPSEAYLITIGNHVQITHNVSFFTHGGAHVVRKQIPDFDIFGKIEIEDWCYIGSHSLIMPGVTIGEGSLVAAGSIVTKSVPAGFVVAGNPAKPIGTVEDFMNKHKINNISTNGIKLSIKKSLLLSLPEERFIKK